MEKLVSEERYDGFDFEIWSFTDDDDPYKEYYFYKILSNNPDQKFWSGSQVLRESDESFETAQEAKFAAVGHINLLANGEG